MKYLVVYLFFFAADEGAQSQFGNDLFHLTLSFLHAQSLDDISSISSKIGRLDVDKQITTNNIDDVRALKREIDQFLSLELSVKLEFIAAKKQFMEVYFRKVNGPLDRADKYRALLALETKISKMFPEESALSWLYKLTVIDIEGRLIQSQMDHTAISRMIKAYEIEYGKNSLFLADLYWFLVRKLTKNGNFNEALVLNEKAKDLAAKYTSKRSRRFYCLEIFAVKNYIGIGDIDRAINAYSSINVEEMHSICTDLPYELYIFNSSASILSASKNKIDNAILYQESALIHLEGAVDKGDPALPTEARKLRDLLVKKGDWPSVRKVEKQYKLDPLPKQSDEK